MQIIHLNQNNFRLYPQVWMVQNDTGRTLKMILDDTTLAGTETGSVAIHRSDGSYYTISATIVGADNAFTADMTQALTQPGLTECQLKVTSSSLVVSTYTFMIHVQASTDGISEEQLGYSVQDLMDAAQTIISGGFTPEVKAALLQIAAKVAYIDEDGQDYYDALDAALNPPANLVSISAAYTQSGVVYPSTSLDDLKPDLVVTATYSDSSTETIASSAYTLSGTLTVGTSVITVSYGGKTTTFNVTVTAYIYPMTILATDDGNGFGTADATKPTNTPAYIGNTQATRIHAIGADNAGFPVQYGKSYKITLSNALGTEGLGGCVFNESGATKIENLQSLAPDYQNFGWIDTSDGYMTYTPPIAVNNSAPTGMWIWFRKNSSNAAWSSYADIFPITIEEV